MASEQKTEDEQQQVEAAMTSAASAGGFRGRVVDQYRKLKDHAKAYLYVWGSYIVVYGGFGLYLAYRWSKLAQSQDSAASSSSSSSSSAATNATPK